VDLAVDGARQHQELRPAVALARRRLVAGDAFYPSLAGEHVAALDHAVGQNDRTDKNLIAHGSPSRRLLHRLA
jgi:hypothetical protein